MSSRRCLSPNRNSFQMLNPASINTVTRSGTAVMRSGKPGLAPCTLPRMFWVTKSVNAIRF